MSKSFIRIVLVITLFCFISCKKDNNEPQSLIAGNWNMQSLHYVEYLNNVKQQDTIESTSEFSNQVQFNNDGSFMNIYTYNVTHDTIAGSYKVNGKSLSFSNYHSNFVFIPTPFPLFFPARADSNITTSNQITQITTSNLIIHSESNLHDSAGNVDTKIITDQYYSK